ncbi:glycoside hydrolase family 127 protein [Fibrella sp. HMF5335]|uniref:Glycoside hydrolase family 127 protein n=1 Tax=Fibrella rubiginis TaxID=2817060 RepID=A0A939GBM5_9BACT|nr:beta-L-arabinofuranosidase domain-containing protein [Fibrella rubiginis]MBO0936057.1 glycoside hydrolase family 127 protein [Fibrella rubiginis]
MNRFLRLFSLLVLSISAAGQSQPLLPKPAVADRITDHFAAPVYEGNATLDGYVGDRMRINLERRLLTLNLPSILEPYQHRPGKQTWIGEHVGKFIHAAGLTWQYMGNPRLKTRMDSAARLLIATQLSDGYLGTYLDKDRWTDWDVWSHKYNLIGLLTYYQLTGDQAALTACRKVGNLLVRTFQTEKRDLIKAGWHVGMAATSVLEPMVMLYRYTGDPAYLGFCQFVVSTWEQPNGPKILTSLLDHGSVYKTANGKAYEMLSNLVGLADLYRMTGDERYLKAGTNAWQDIMTKRHYLTGTSSWGEHFRDDFSLRPDGEVHGDKYESAGEGCVTVTWQQLNLQLLRLSGNPKYAAELERITYNSLVGAQSPQDGSVCYFIPMNGRKRFGEVSHGILPDVSCCASSIPRGVALIPQYIAGSLSGGQAVVWQYVSGRYPIQLITAGKNQPVTLQIRTAYPQDGKATITVSLPQPAKSATRFALQLRVPDWCSDYRATVGGQTYAGKAGQLLTLERSWQNGEQVMVTMSLDLQAMPDPNKGSEGVIVQRGPQVLAEDDRLDTVDKLPANWFGGQFYQLTGKVGGQTKQLRLVPFAEAGQTQGHYRVVLDNLTNLHYKR